MNAFSKPTGPSLFSARQTAAAKRALANPLRVQPITHFNCPMPSRSDKDKTFRISAGKP